MQLTEIAQSDTEAWHRKSGESVLGEATHNGIFCRKLPDDPLAVLRISIGEDEQLKPSAYCVIRGDKLRCLDVLRRAIRALERSDF